MADFVWFEDEQELAEALAASVANDLTQALAQQPRASLALSGGRSPIPVFEALQACELDWARVDVTLVDERWVPESDPASNGALVRRHLLQGRAAAARFVPLFDGKPSAKAAEVEVGDALRQLAVPFAALILGMGEDGHTASLFPQSPNLSAGLALGQSVGTTPPVLEQVADKAPFERISLSLPWILHSERIYVQIAGAAKIGVLEAASQAPNPLWPISYVMTQSATPVVVYVSRN